MASALLSHIQEGQRSREMITENRYRFNLKRTISLAFIASLLLLLFIGLISYQRIVDLLKTSERVENTYQVMTELDDVFSTLKDAESSVRGYVITGNDSYLGAYHNVFKANESLNRLRSLAKDGSQQQKISIVTPLIRKRTVLMQRTVQLRHHGFDSAYDFVASNNGEQVMEQIRALIVQMKHDENQRLNFQNEQKTKAAERTIEILIAASIVSVLFSGFAGVVIHRDIYKREKLEQETQNVRTFLETVLENIPNMVFVKDAAHLRFVSLNKAGEQILGYSRNELLGKNDYDFFPKLDADTFTAKDREVLEKDIVIDIPDESIHSKTGDLHILHTRKTCILDSSGNPAYLLGISEDITNRWRAEKDLDSFFMLSLDMLCIAGFDGFFKRLNPAWEKFGFSLEELMSKPYADFIHPDDRAKTEAEAGKISAGASTLSFENRYVCKDGSYKWLLWNAVPLMETGLIYATARDITDRKETESQIQELNSQLNHQLEELTFLNREMESFSYSVSHDLRAPLRHILGYADLLRKSTGSSLSEKSARFLNVISDAAKQMGKLIDDLLEFSRMGRKEVHKQKVNLQSIVQDVLSESMVGLDDRKIEWKVGPLPTVEADPNLIKIVLTNLISNAVKYTGTRDRAIVEIGSESDGSEEIKFFVRDNGVGFDMKYQEKLYGVFQRLHQSEDFAGTGIGLANVKRIIHRHGGRTWAEGVVDAGATFYFTLPEGV